MSKKNNLYYYSGSIMLNLDKVSSFKIEGGGEDNCWVAAHFRHRFTQAIFHGTKQECEEEMRRISVELSALGSKE
jgi:hypothetical protein